MEMCELQEMLPAGWFLPHTLDTTCLPVKGELLNWDPFTDGMFYSPQKG